jgi:Ala-tRNA(Pro) deacylase
MVPAAISNFLERHHAQYSLRGHPTAFTAQEEAAAAHVPGSEWAKTIVCMADDRPILAVVPAPSLIDLHRLQRAAQAHSIRLASEREFALLFDDCELGAIPPLGPLYGRDVFVDQSLTRDPVVFFSAGSHQMAIGMPYSEFDRLVHPTVGEFAGGLASAPMSRTKSAIDPVCGADVREEASGGRSDHRGETYYFCSQCCKMEFDDNPDAYAKLPRAG